MSLTLADVEKIAHLARLELTEAEKQKYLEQLSAILHYAERLNELDLADSPAHCPRHRPTKRHPPRREPTLLCPSTTFSSTPLSKEGNQFVVQAVLDE